MKDRPILFSAPMVRSILAGTKTQTRRVVKMKSHQQIEERDDGSPWPWMYDGERDADSWMACPYGQPGDRLWVREAWALVPRTAYRCSEGVQQTLRPDDDHDAAIYRAGWSRSNGGFRWRPSIHMPRWASRILLEVTEVRVERLQDISEEDAKAEGATPIPDPCDHVRLSCSDIGCSGPQPYRLGYRALWNHINGPGSWDANPWVWAVSFKQIPSPASTGGTSWAEN